MAVMMSRKEPTTIDLMDYYLNIVCLFISIMLLDNTSFCDKFLCTCPCYFIMLLYDLKCCGICHSQYSTYIHIG